MHLLIRSYDLVELQRLRAELDCRGIAVYMSDEFTFAIPGLPGAEQPRALWVTDEDDLVPARRVIADLLGEERLPDTAASPSTPVPAAVSSASGRPASPPAGRRTPAVQRLSWVAGMVYGIIVALLALLAWA